MECPFIQPARGSAGGYPGEWSGVGVSPRWFASFGPSFGVLAAAVVKPPALDRIGPNMSNVVD